MRTFHYFASGQVSEDIRDPSNDYTFSYDNNGRSVTAKLNGSAVGSYLYNAFEQRVEKSAGSADTHFILDRFGHLLAEADGSTGAAIREYIWLDDLPVAVVDDTGASPVLYFIHTDQLGTPQKITDASASIVWDGAFDPFGNPASLTGSLTSNLRFPGQYFDAETALHQNWNRDYDPTTGRYVQSDPIGLDGGINTYAYVDDNPLGEFDKNGEQFLPEPLLEPLLRAPFRFPVPEPFLSPKPNCDWKKCLADWERLNDWCHQFTGRKREACLTLANDNLTNCRKGWPPKQWPFDWIEPPPWYEGEDFLHASL